jgi:hexosaminidase
MKAKLLLCVFLIVGVLKMQIQAQIKTEVTPISILPQPTKLTPVTGNFTITNATKMIVPNDNADILRVALMFADRLKIDGTKVPIIDLNNSKSNTNVIFFLKTEDEDLGTEGYRLSVTPSQININAATAQGFFYAVQSLLQLLPTEVFSPTPYKSKITWRIPCVEIEDQPRYKYRGLHLDVGRHFQPVSFVKKFIDMMAMHKMNNFHWHLTEDQGWRIEIKKYPKLTEVGAWRKETLIGHNNADGAKKYDGERYGGFYTQAEIREVVAYAKERFVNIIPEIEMPGHAQAALAAYPELSCDPTKQYEVATSWGVFKDVFCPTEKTFTFLEDVLTEVMDLFPSKYIHIGGDECPKDAWKKSAFCQDLMKKEGLKDEHELQSYFIQRIEKFLNAKGRSIIGWDEILEGGLAPNATVMSWRGTEGGITAAQQDHDVIMTPGSHCYLDKYQADPETEPLAIGGLITLETAYSYEPTPTILNNEQAKHIIGAQGNVWTEYLRYSSQVEYMAFPRAIALAEVLWTTKSRRNYDNFITRLQTHFKRLDRMKVNYANHLYELKVDFKSDDAITANLSTPAKNADIRYTTDGSLPTIKSTLYTKPFDIKNIDLIRAASFQNGRAISKILTQSIYPHSALGMKYTLTNPAKNTYQSGAKGLTNGIRGTEKTYNQWTGFEGNDMEVVFDFGKPRPFSLIEMAFLNKPSSWIFLPDYVIVAVSNDGKEWLDIDRADFAHSRSKDKTYIKEAKMRFSEYTKPKRYVKIYAKSIGVCPEGHAGEGKAAWLFADEIIIE